MVAASPRWVFLRCRMSKPETKHELLAQVQRDHEELREMLGIVSRTLSRRESSVPAVVEALTRLGRDVAQHFSDEESAGLFSDIESRAPRMADRVAELRAEHQRLADAIADLQNVAARGDGSDAWWEQVGRAYQVFSKELMHHESYENELLLRAYTDDIGSGD